MLAAVILFVFTVAATAQQTPDFSTVKTEKGMMVLNNNQVQPFSFLVAGKNPNARQNDDGSLQIATDSGSLIVYFIKTSAFLDKKKSYNEAETLAAHRVWDVAAQENAWQAKLKNLDKGENFVKIFNLTNSLFPTKTISTVYWSYNAPRLDNLNRTLYQTVLIGDLILMLGTVFDQSVKPEEVRTFFTQTLESLTILPAQKQTAAPKKKVSPAKTKKH